MYHFSNDRMTRPKSRGDWVNSQRSGLWGTEQFPLSISSCPSAGFITDICTHWLHSRDRKLILHGLPFTGVQCALLRNLKMLEGTRFTSNLIQKLGRGCVCVCVCMCARAHAGVCACMHTYSVVSDSACACVCVCVCLCVCSYAYLLSCVWLFATPWSAACEAPLSGGFFQARILEWVAVSFTRGSSRLRDRTWVSCTVGKFITGWATRETPEEGEQEKTPWRKITGEGEWAGPLDSDRHGL